MDSLNIHRFRAVLVRLLFAVLAALLLGALTALPALAAGSGTWTPTGNLQANSDAASLTLLQNGQALAAGASGAELYNPSTGTWAYTGSMNATRNDFIATLLTNGQVLAVGGYYNDPVKGAVALASAELYNPSTGKWTYTGSLHTARWSHTATLLQNGEVLVAGGETLGPDGRISFASAELYNPATGQWKATGSMTTVRRGHTMTLLTNGKVLVAGGADSAGNYLASVELYDPTTGIWTTTGSLHTARYLHTAALLQNGDVLVAGGAYNVYYPTYTAEYYTP
jgi:hypothetical protein